MRAIIPLVAFGLLLAAAPAQAFYADAEFVEFYSDVEGDMIGFHDITSMAIAENGNDQVLVRISVADASIASPAGGYNVMIFYAVDGTWLAPGCDVDGAPTYFGNADGVNPIQCAIDGSNIYFELTYEMLHAEVGHTITASGAAYCGIGAGNLICDHGGPGASGSFTGDGAGAYTYTGCTRADGCAPPVEPVLPETFYANLTEAAAHAALGFTEPSQDTYVYNWTSATDNVEATLNATIEAGSFQWTIVDEAGTVLLTDTGADGNQTLTLEGMAGNWTATYTFTDFVGTVGFDLVPVVEEGDETQDPEPQQQGTSSEPNEPETEDLTDDETEQPTEEEPASEDAPGLPLVALLAVLALLTRRQR